MQYQFKFTDGIESLTIEFGSGSIKLPPFRCLDFLDATPVQEDEVELNGH